VAQECAEYEIIPVDNNSTDATPDVIRKATHRFPALIRPTEERSIQSSYAARNAGIAHARGDVLAFIDADMTAPPDWLSRIAAAFTRTETDYLGYETEIVIPDGEKGLWGWYDQKMGLPSRYHYEQKQFVPTSCLAVRASLLETVGRFNERLISSGDREFGERAHAHPDVETTFTDEIVVYHPARTTFRAHVQKALRIGRGLVQVQSRAASDQQAQTALSDLFDHLLPPDPRRIYRRADGESPSQYALLYAMDWIIRYIRLYGALAEYVEASVSE
jgi:glycosyltransferase involved in cell wall biosynthesis